MIEFAPDIAFGIATVTLIVFALYPRTRER
jgi:hypothetical protein